MIHPSAIIAPGASLGMDVSIGPYAVIGPDVIIGDRCSIGAHAVVGVDERPFGGRDRRDLRFDRGERLLHHELRSRPVPRVRERHVVPLQVQRQHHLQRRAVRRVPLWRNRLVPRGRALEGRGVESGGLQGNRVSDGGVVFEPTEGGLGRAEVGLEQLLDGVGTSIVGRLVRGGSSEPASETRLTGQPNQARTFSSVQSVC